MERKGRKSEKNKMTEKKKKHRKKKKKSPPRKLGYCAAAFLRFMGIWGRSPKGVLNF